MKPSFCTIYRSSCPFKLAQRSGCLSLNTLSH
jgi:hypothetical protein